MDNDGNLVFLEQHEVGWALGGIIAVSGEGRVVAYGATSSPTLSLFFIGEHGLISPPVHLDIPPPDYSNNLDFNTVVFHPEIPLLFAGFLPISSHRYSLDEQTIEPTGFTTTENFYIWNWNLGFSSYSNSIVFARLTSPSPRTSGIQTLRVNGDGSFGDASTSATQTNLYVKDIAVSPNGRWAVVVTQSNPRLSLYRIGSDGTPALAQELDIPTEESTGHGWLAFTPDGRNLLWLAEFGTHRLNLFELDETEGKLARRSWIGERPGGLRIAAPRAITVTPDGRHAAFRAQNPENLSHDLIRLVRIHEDGTLEYLSGKEVDVPYLQWDLAFAPLPEAGVKDWAVYE